MVFFDALMRTTEPVITTSANAYRPTANTEEGIRILTSKYENVIYPAHRFGREYSPALTVTRLRLPSESVRALATPNRRPRNRTWKPFIMCVMENPARQ